MNRELRSTTRVVQLYAPTTTTADANSRYVDLQGYDSADILVTYSDVTASTGSNNFAIKVFEASATPATLGSYTEVAATNLRGTFPSLANAVTGNVALVSYVGNKRYLYVQLDETGTASAIVSIVAVLRNPAQAASNAATVTTGTVS